MGDDNHVGADMTREEQLEAAATKAKAAFDAMFQHCLSNGVFNAWGKPMNCMAINEAVQAIDAALTPPDPWSPPPEAERPDGYRCWSWHIDNDGRGAWFRSRWRINEGINTWWVYGIGYVGDADIKHFLPEPPAPGDANGGQDE
jgi:hypothetical protein